jgi:TetR/AcrR family transcriptional regulator, mexJK operon transcriptional repressor
MSGGNAVAKPLRPKAQALRLRIVSASRDAFLAEGWDASMDTVAAAAGTTKATVYKYFGNKEALFIGVIKEELDRALAEPTRLVASRLAESTRVRDDLMDACRAWVAAVATPEMIAWRNLISGEIRRFPELGKAWQELGPQRFHPVVAEALQRLVAMRQLSISDIKLAVLQLSGLVLSANLVHGAYGNRIDPELADRLIVSGVDMFVNHYQYRANV